MNKYLKYVLYLLSILLILYLGQKQQRYIINSVSADSLKPIEPPHSQDYAYKRAYLNPVNKNNEVCRANPDESTCTSSCMGYHYNFSKCVFAQPHSVSLNEEYRSDNRTCKENNTETVIKSLKYY